MRFVILLLKMYCGLNFRCSERHSGGCRNKLVFNIIFAVRYPDYNRAVFFNGLVNAEQINVKLLSVAAENSGNISVVYRIDKIIFFFSVYISYRTVDFYIYRL